MLINFFKVAIRNLWRNKTISIINIAGLSIGLACCMLIFLYAKDEWSYDRFHVGKDHIFRITALLVDDKNKEQFRTGKTGAVHGPSFKQDIPEISTYIRIAGGTHIIRKGSETFNQRVHLADSNFFSVFSFPLLAGNPATALMGVRSMVFTEQMAKKYFGTTDVIGKSLEIEFNKKWEAFTITAVARDCPQNSTIKFDIVLPMAFYDTFDPDNQWMNFDLSTFVVLAPGSNPQAIPAKMDQVFLTGAADQLKAAREKYGFKGAVKWGLQPLIDIHLSKDYDAEDELSDPSDPAYSYILIGIAIFILLIACINFINLTVGRSLKRSQEIGIRKVIGSSRSQLIFQFLGESFLACGIAFFLALILAFQVLPLFNDLANKHLSLSYLLSGRLVLGFIAFFLLTAFAAGFYPALILSAFNPVETLYRRLRLAGRDYLAKGLILVQFALAGLLIISTLFVFLQFHYLTHQDLGYNDSNLVTVNFDATNNEGFAQLFSTELETNASIQNVGIHNNGRWGTSAKVDGKEIQFDFEHIDDNYFQTLRIPVILGRNFSSAFPTDSNQSVIVNETFARQAGLKDPIGKTLDFTYINKKMTIIGVIKDFHFRPLSEAIGAEVFAVINPASPLQFNIRIAPRNITPTLTFIGATFKKYAPWYPFSYTFRHDDNFHAYDAEEKWQQIISIAAAFTIFISCIGLFGLTTLTAERRMKEIGIRKVLGASVPSLIRLLSLNFLSLVFIANLIALPIAWWAVHKWLANFAYHITIQWWVFALAIGITVLIALSTITFKAFKAAVANPVRNLRH